MVSLENQDVVPTKKQKTSILDNFSKLKYDQVKVRVKNGAAIVKYLKKNEADQKVNDELNRTLVRLIRGLGSPLVNARAGYFSTLVVLLQAHDVTFEQIYEVFTKQLSTGGNNSKSENADVYCGQILLWGALIRAGLYGGLSQEDQGRLLEVLLEAGRKRSYLSLMSTMFILELIEQTDDKCFAMNIWQTLKKEVDKPWREQTLDGAFLVVCIHRKFPKFLRKKSGVCKIEDLRLGENLEALCTLLMDVPLLITVKHPVYKIIPGVLLQMDLAEDFVRKADEHLTRTNRNRLIVMVTILKELLNNTSGGVSIAHFFGDNFVKQTLLLLQSSQQKHKDEEFEKTIQTLFVSVVDALKKPDVKWQTKIAVIEKFLFDPGVFTFEKITKSRVVQQIINTLCDEGVKKMAEMYKSVVAKSTQIGSLVNNDRVYAAQLLAKLLNHPSVQADFEWKLQQLLFLLKMGLTKNDCVGTELALSIKKTFFGSALNVKFVKLHNVCSILSGLTAEIDGIIENTRTMLRDDVNDETVEVWQRTRKLIQKLEKKSKSNKVKGVFHFLFLQMSLQLFNDTKLAVDSLSELFSCYEKSKKSSQIDLSEGDPLWIEVVIELFLNLLSHKSHLLRSVVGYVFPHLCEYVDESAMNQILSVLDVKDDPLEESDESSGDDDSDGDESDGEDTSDETVSDRLRTAVRNALGGHQTDEESVDLDDMSETEANRLDAALAEAFKQVKPNRGRNKKQTKHQEALTHFRVRALDLIDMYFDGHPKMSVVLQTIVPLLEVLEYTIRNPHQEPLHNRVASCLKKMSTLKNIEADDTTATILGDLLKSLLEKGTKTTLVVQEMGDKIADSCTFILRCRHLLKTSDSTPKKLQKKLGVVDEIVNNEMEVHFKKKESLTVYVLLKTILAFNWVENIGYVSRLYGYIFATDVKQFRKNQALELLRVFYKNTRILSNDEIAPILQECEENLARNTREFFNGFDQTAVNVPNKFICSLLNLLVLIKHNSNKNGSIDWHHLIESVKTYRSKLPFVAKDTKQAYNQLCNSIGVTTKIEGITTTEMTKPKGTTNNCEPTRMKTPTKKKPKGKLLKLKKESQELRLKNSSEGLEGVSFATTNLREIGDDEGQPDGDTERGVKRPKGDGGGKRKKVKKNRDKSNE